MSELIERRELKQLQSWFEGRSRKPLVIRGARQVGKSTLVRQFARKLGLELVEANFERNPEYAQAFSTNDPKRVLATLGLLMGKSIDIERSLLFLDEIQSEPQALAVLRYFYEEMPGLPVVSAGSLLEFTLEDINFSMPVGRIDYMHLGPLAFTDFLQATGEGVLAAHLEELNIDSLINWPAASAIHEKLMALYRTYCVVGGMPEAVSAYASSKNYAEVMHVQSNVLATYRDDFSKYSHGALTDRVRLVFERAPALMGQKFKYVNLSRDHRASGLREALDQLCLARVLHRIHHSAANGVPLGAESSEKIFKLLFLDVGLMCAALGINELDIEKEGPYLVNRGAIAEQFVGQHLLYGKDYYMEPKAYYWMREAKSAAAEVDYLLPVGQHIVPIEIKAGSTGTLRSLHQFCLEKGAKAALRFNGEPPSALKGAVAKTSQGEAKYNLLSLPLYMVEKAYVLTEQFLEPAA